MLALAAAPKTPRNRSTLRGAGLAQQGHVDRPGSALHQPARQEQGHHSHQDKALRRSTSQVQVCVRWVNAEDDFQLLLPASSLLSQDGLCSRRVTHTLDTQRQRYKRCHSNAAHTAQPLQPFTQAAGASLHPGNTALPVSAQVPLRRHVRALPAVHLHCIWAAPGLAVWPSQGPQA